MPAGVQRDRRYGARLPVAPPGWEPTERAASHVLVAGRHLCARHVRYVARPGDRIGACGCGRTCGLCWLLDGRRAAVEALLAGALAN